MLVSKKATEIIFTRCFSSSVFFGLKLHYSYNYIVNYMSNNIIIKSVSYFQKNFLSHESFPSEVTMDIYG